MKMTLTGMGALASLLIGMSGSALADTNTYAGALCEPLVAGQAFTRGVAFGIGNPNALAAATYVCPLVRDNLPASFGFMSGAKVVVKDFTTTGHITCILTSRFAEGGQVGANGAITKTTGDDEKTGVQTLEFGPLPTSTTGYLTLHCILPKKASAGGQGTSRVISYRATEL
jgi:hypothetical protein